MFSNRVIMIQGFRKLWQIISNNFNSIVSIFRRQLSLNKIPNIILTCFCIGGLFYQCYDITQQYMTGQTFVSITFRNRIPGPIPAITLCFLDWLSMPKFAEQDARFDKYYQVYLEHLEKFSNVDGKLNYSAIYQDYWIRYPFYRRIYEKWKNDFWKKSIPLNDWFNNYSITDQMNGTNLFDVTFHGFIIVDGQYEIIKLSNQENSINNGNIF